MKFDDFQLRINQKMSSGAPGWIHIKLNPFSIKNHTNNELYSSRLDPCSISTVFNYKCIEIPQQILRNPTYIMILMVLSSMAFKHIQKVMCFSFRCISFSNSIHKERGLFSVCLFLRFWIINSGSRLGQAWILN